MIEIPHFGGEGKEKALKIVDWVGKNIKASRLTLPALLKLGTESPAEIFAAGKTTAVFGCLNRAALIGALLKQNDFGAFLVSERIYFKGKPVGIHFFVEATNGKSNFTVDPNTLNTGFFDGWIESQKSLYKPFFGAKNLTAKRIMRKEIPANAMQLSCFQIAGIKGRINYLKRAKIRPLSLFEFAKERSTANLQERIKKAREKKPGFLIKKNRQPVHA